MDKIRRKAEQAARQGFLESWGRVDPGMARQIKI